MATNATFPEAGPVDGLLLDRTGASRSLKALEGHQRALQRSELVTSTREPVCPIHINLIEFPFNPREPVRLRHRKPERAKLARDKPDAISAAEPANLVGIGSQATSCENACGHCALEGSP